MRYIIMIIIGLSLIACNLSTPDASSVIEAAPTAISHEISDEELGNITFWQSFAIDEVTPTEDDIVIIEQLVLRRMESDIPRTGMPIIDLEWALQAMFESDNIWTANNVTIESLSIQDGLATIELNGSISAVGGAILSIIPLQIQLTVFEEDSIDTILMTLECDIANFAISHSSQTQAIDFIFSRDALYAELGRRP